MIALRVVGGVFAVLLLVGAARQHQRRNISRLSLLITWLVGMLIVLLAIAPVVFNPVFDVFKFKKGTGGRLIGVLLFANVVAFLLLFRNMSTIDSAARSIRMLDADEARSEEHTSELQSRGHLVCRLLLEKKKHDS